MGTVVVSPTTAYQQMPKGKWDAGREQGYLPQSWDLHLRETRIFYPEILKWVQVPWTFQAYRDFFLKAMSYSAELQLTEELSPFVFSEHLTIDFFLYSCIRRWWVVIHCLHPSSHLRQFRFDHVSLLYSVLKEKGSCSGYSVLTWKPFQTSEHISFFFFLLSQFWAGRTGTE